ncbi:hypothetical protein [Azospirillum thermophilum]|uniref:Uncharacterized protein n=1 Tax=Azospirillum thermophilum TaxID=2202148 RepID=A0A2S2CWD8_9PROT|nr:hypothetical protein [Azospirillum thermophilum]AWK88710.1 hypothetical protein DEW08_21720 [Azospirillum thermophilum]
MLDIATLRKAIEDVEQAATAAPGLEQNGLPALGRLYSAYAQAVLNANGLRIDLDDLCCQTCRFCPAVACRRDRLWS